MDAALDVYVDQSATMPPYEQLRRAIAARINDGTLVVGAKLPTVRALATRLELAANTVARAYRELEAAGLLETRGRAGTYVGSSGDVTRERLRRAAEDFAQIARETALPLDEALAIVTAALRTDERCSRPRSHDRRS